MYIRLSPPNSHRDCEAATKATRKRRDGGRKQPRSRQLRPRAKMKKTMVQSPNTPFPPGPSGSDVQQVKFSTQSLFLFLFPQHHYPLVAVPRSDISRSAKTQRSPLAYHHHPSPRPMTVVPARVSRNKALMRGIHPSRFAASTFPHFERG